MSSNEGWQRLQDLEAELERIKQKIEKAAGYGFDIDDLTTTLEDFETLLGEAYAEEASNELETAEDEAKRLKDGKPAKPCPQPNGPGDQNPPPPPGGAGGGVVVGIPIEGQVIGDGGKRTEPGGAPVFVRGQYTVWAWNRFDQVWVSQRFQMPIKQVDQVSGGLLAVAQFGAALFDAGIAQWLTPLSTVEEIVETGAGPIVDTGGGASALDVPPHGTGIAPGDPAAPSVAPDFPPEFDPTDPPPMPEPVDPGGGDSFVDANFGDTLTEPLPDEDEPPLPPPGEPPFDFPDTVDD